MAPAKGGLSTDSPFHSNYIFTFSQRTERKMYNTNSLQIDPSILSYVLKLKGRRVVTCQILGDARIFEDEMLAWYSTLENKRRLDA